METIGRLDATTFTVAVVFTLGSAREVAVMITVVATLGAVNVTLLPVAGILPAVAVQETPVAFVFVTVALKVATPPSPIVHEDGDTAIVGEGTVMVANAL